ncbi:Piso0_002396 [Millerozyma farinosa CBS 7064]|uniref:Piso0_002396 protein n=1 Tax=Pichia sorbitophila (strain ATCC MYA-4447 / BCRC 22081 / CBS 7064 / NBRC 10061 / NRRL Y-12695) TaxID=559304 RepID=G8YCI0_PICSO|nr:Piso0_002396 [Millerozyma farinosa CBS 7064]
MLAAPEDELLDDESSADAEDESARDRSEANTVAANITVPIMVVDFIVRVVSSVFWKGVLVYCVFQANYMGRTAAFEGGGIHSPIYIACWQRSFHCCGARAFF